MQNLHRVYRALVYTKKSQLAEVFYRFQLKDKS
jgi:hypothetical protein